MASEVFLRYLLPLIFLGSGIGLLTAALANVVRTRRFLATAVATTGTVVALQWEPSTDSGEAPTETYRPTITFRTGYGQMVAFKSLMHSSPPAYAVGAPVPVLYDPHCHEEARIRSFATLWLLAIILGGLGTVFTVLGAALLLGAIPL